MYALAGEPCSAPAGHSDREAICQEQAERAQQQQRRLPIRDVQGRYLTLGVGSDIGLREGMAIDLRDRKVKARGEIIAINKHSAIVRLFVNQHIEPPLVAVVSPRGKSPDILAPPPERNLGVFEVGSSIGADVHGNGVFVGAFAHAGFRFKGPWSLNLYIDPVEAAWGEVQDTLFSSATALFSWDSRVLSIGVGAGLGWEAGGTRYDYKRNEVWPLFAASARVGTIDGLNVSARAQVSLNHYAFDLFELGLRVPVSRGHRPVWLDFRGRMSENYGSGNVGVRWRASGEGRGGTFHVTPFAGFKILDTIYGRTTDYVGAGVYMVGPEVGLRVQVLAGR